MNKFAFLAVSICALVPFIAPAQAQQSMYDYVVNQAVGPQGSDVSQYDASQIPTLDVDAMYPRQPAAPQPHYGDVQIINPPTYSHEPYCLDGSIPLYEYCADGSSALYR